MLIAKIVVSLWVPVRAIAQDRNAITQEIKLDIYPAQAVSKVSPMLYGLMTEEINHSYEGGLYAELIQNRTFHTTWEGILSWNLQRYGDSRASMAMDNGSGPSAALPASLKLTVAAAAPGSEAGLRNAGFWGIAVRPRTAYRGSFFAKGSNDPVGPMTASLVNDNTGAIAATAKVELKTDSEWHRYEFTLTTGEVEPSSLNHFELTTPHPGAVWLQLISLMSPTYHDRPNGNRSDLMDRMAGLSPKFLRLPGGNYLEGDTLADWYDWRKTLGPLVDRPGHQAPWTYWSTDGLGLLEFLEWCEDLKIEPVLAVYAGYSLKGEHVQTGTELEPYVQAAIDEVEYVTGGPETKWGAERARNGHPAPFPLHYIEIGNEDWLDKSGSYEARYAQFAPALRKRYPQYKLIATAPLKGALQPDVYDEHYYKTPEEMMELVHHYDQASRTGPKIFIGEWATRSGTPTPNFADALGDAALMTSMERNSDLICMSAYAPMLVNVSPGAMQWSTDLIGFDAMKTYASPSYYAQVLFAGHLGDETPWSSLTGAGDRFFYSATVDSTRRILHLKLVNAYTRELPLELTIEGLKQDTETTLNALHARTFDTTNSIQNPDVIVPLTSTIRVAPVWKHAVPPLTIEVLDIPLP